MDQVLNRIIYALFERLGRRYVVFAAVVELAASSVVAAISIPLLLTYFRPSTRQFIDIYIVVGAVSLAGLVPAMVRGAGHLDPVMDWLDARPDLDVDRGADSPAAAHADPDEASEVRLALAWDAATNYAMRSFRANSLSAWVSAAVPAAAFITYDLKLHWAAGLIIFAAAVIPIVYATAVNYALAELLLRPAVSQISAALPDDFPFTANGLLLRKRMKLIVPIFTCFSGFVVAALMSHHGGIRGMAEGVGVAAGVGLLFSFELTVLLSRSVTGPVAGLRHGLARIREGELAARVPVMTSDELGELTRDFNVMAKGLQEREEMRQAFMTYVDPYAVPLILSGRYPRSGVEVDVSILFLDVRGFTAFAERSSATEVIATLNVLFEEVVPIVTAHGGHVDKFLGDGLLAVFGAPEGYLDHADRALAAGVEMVNTVNDGDGELTIGVGINSGPVVVGSIGGAGRLNFSVIGDAVNVAARVEAATRETGDGLLLTEATREALTRPVELQPRARVALKGKSEPIAVYAWPGLSGIQGSARSRIARAIRR